MKSVSPKSSVLLCGFGGAKGLNAKDIHKEMFPVYGGKFLSRKAIHNWVETFFQGRLKVAGDPLPGAEVAETTVRRLLCCGFRRTGKQMGQVFQCCWRICRKIHVFFFRFEYHMYYVLYLFVACVLIDPRTVTFFSRNLFHACYHLSCQIHASLCLSRCEVFVERSGHRNGDFSNDNPVLIT
jgi:hypothetical protein